MLIWTTIYLHEVFMKLKKNVAKRAIISEAYGDCLTWYLINRIERYMYFKPVPTGIDYLIKPAGGGLNLETISSAEHEGLFLFNPRRA